MVVNKNGIGAENGVTTDRVGDVPKKQRPSFFL
jgi:hypothetical protein